MVVSGGGGIVARPAETLLTERAVAYLAGGPSDVVPLIAHICQLTAPPRVVAEHMAVALFADRPEFSRNAEGLWYLTPEDHPHVRGPVDSGAVARGLVGFSCSPVTKLGYQVTRSPGGFASADPERAETDSGVASTLIPNPVGDPLASLSYVVVDVETTGGRAWAGDRITEVAAVVVRDGEIREVFETLVNPQRPIPPVITALTNITWTMVRDAPLFREVCGDLLDVLSGHVFVAHNAGFDWRFLTAEVSRASGHRLDGRRLCTVRLARRFLPHLRSRSLDSLASYYGVEITARHRAGGDAVATAKVLLRLLGEAHERGCEDWTTLQTLLLTVPRRRRRGRRSALPRSVDRDGSA
jgi:DNA polymerase-3 subunit epsilon